MKNNIYQDLVSSSKNRKKKLAVLIDPDKCDLQKLPDFIEASTQAKVDLFFIGGSLLLTNHFHQCIEILKNQDKIPVVIFPGNHLQINNKADGILLLSLISGRNPEFLIGQHVLAAPKLKESNLEILPTGYLLVSDNATSAVAYVSNTQPIPSSKTEIAVCTAMAGEQLGLKLIYLEAGSGAEKPVPEEMITMVKSNISIPLIVGGGIRTTEAAIASCKAGADIIVIGNAFEKDFSNLKEIAQAIHSA